VQLPTTGGHVDIAHPADLLLYFATFGLLASLWLIYHGLMSGAFKPTGADLVLAFAYLALVSLMPYALYAITHDNDRLSHARAAVGTYTALYAIMTALAAILSMRNLRRGFYFVRGRERDRVWLAFLRQCTLCFMMSLALTVDLTFGPNWSIFVFMGMFAAVRAIRFLFPRAPTATALRLKSTTTSSTPATPAT